MEGVPANRRWLLNGRLAVSRQPYAGEKAAEDVDTLMEYRALLVAELQSVEGRLRALGGFTVNERVE